MSNKVVAIDGPSASGKSTVARRVATAVGYLYVDSGALYRGVTWSVLKSRIRTNDRSGIVRAVNGMDVRFSVADGSVNASFDGIDPGEELRSACVEGDVSPVAAVPEVRAKVNGWLREMSRIGDVVVEGRDIGSAVFPDAEFKFYLDADPAERARRRHKDFSRDGSGSSVSDVGLALRRRDMQDASRKVDPLKIAPGAVVVDTTSLGIDEVVGVILERVRSARC